MKLRRLGVQSEADLQGSIVTWLHLALPKGSLVFEFGKPGARPKCPHCGAIVGALAGGVPAGWFDLLVIVAGTLPPRYFHLEVKVKARTLEHQQREMLIDLWRIGARAILVRSIGDLARDLIEAGVDLRLEAP